MFEALHRTAQTWDGHAAEQEAIGESGTGAHQERGAIGVGTTGKPHLRDATIDRWKYDTGVACQLNARRGVNEILFR